MTRMALRGLFARKLRTALTGFAVVIGVAFVAGTFIFTDTINASFDRALRAASRRASTSTSPPSSPSRATSAAGSSRCPPGTLEKVRRCPAWPPSTRGSRRRSRSSTRTASRSAATDRRRSSSPPTTERFDPQTYVEGAPRRQGRRGHARPGDRRPRGLQGRRRIQIAGRAPAKEYTLVGISKLGDQSSLGIKSMSMPLSEVQRIERDARAAHGDRRRRATDGTSPEQLKAADHARARRDAPRSAPARSRPSKASADITDSLGFLTIALLVFAGDRGVRRRLPDLQHVRGHRRPALARVRAAADARRLAPPGAQLGRRRDAR